MLLLWTGFNQAKLIRLTTSMTWCKLKHDIIYKGLRGGARLACEVECESFGGNRS